ncbi:MAG: CPBP family glutamic-type intramembrane protease [Planctomycetota bacterium]
MTLALAIDRLESVAAYEEQAWDDGDWESEEWEESDSEADGPAAPGDEAGTPSIALGLLATVPLLLAYEASLAGLDPPRRNVAEILLGWALVPLGDVGAWVRAGLWAAVAVAAAAACFRARLPVGPRLARTLIEGSVAALVMGPAIVLLGRLFGDGAPSLPLEEWYPASSPSLARVAFVAGGAAYEEVCFRFCAFSALFLLVRTLLSFFGLGLLPARFAAEVAGLLGSSLLFAASHLRSFTDLIGLEGWGSTEAFDARMFFRRVLAGAFLFALFRWRGLGVAVWAHALFNAGLALGVGPAVLQSP